MRWRHWIYTVPLRLRSLFQRSRVEQDLADEFRDHVERKTAESLAAGMSLDEARTAAWRSLDGVAQRQEECRDARGVSFVEHLAQDLRYGLRSLRKSPAFAVQAILALALGIGVNVALFTLVFQVLLKPLPYRDAEQLVALWGDASYRNVPKSEPSPADFRDWERMNTSFSAMSAHTYPADVALTRGDRAEMVPARQVGEGFFGVLGVEPRIGRALQPGEGGPGARVAILSDALWQRVRNGRRELEGMTIRIENQEHRVIGIMPAGFEFAASHTDVWLPMLLTEAEWAQRGNYSLQAIGRLKPGVEFATAQAEMSSIANRLAKEYPATNANRGIRLIPLRDELTGSVRTAYFLWFGAAGCVLLVACANVMNMLLLRGARRSRELAVRASLGAPRGRLVQQMLTETALLVIAGSVTGLLLGSLTFDYLRSVYLRSVAPASMAGLVESGIGWPVVLFTIAVASAATFAAGLVPALRLSDEHFSAAMQEGGRGGSGRGTGRIRKALVTSEVGIAASLLVVSGLLTGTLARLNADDLGFDEEHVLTATVRMLPGTYSTREARQNAYEAMFREIRALPGVESVGAGTMLPLQSTAGNRVVEVEGVPYQEIEGRPRVLFRSATEGYFEALGVPLKQGRFFDAADYRESTPVAIINETMQRLYWNGASAAGTRFRWGSEKPNSPWVTVIGVTGDVKQRSVEDGVRPEMVLAGSQIAAGRFWEPRDLAVRASGDPAGLASAVRQAIARIDPSLIVNVQTMDQLRSSKLDAHRMRAVLLSALGGLALILALLGVYSLVSWGVVSRKQEIGVRLALGAKPGSVIGMMVREGLSLTAIGCAAGLLLAASFTWTVEALLYGVAPTEPWIYAATIVLILLVGAIAGYIPARRIASISPAIVLRTE